MLYTFPSPPPCQWLTGMGGAAAKPAAASSWTTGAAVAPTPAPEAAPPKELRIAHQNLPQLVTINDSLPVLKGKPDVKVWVSFAISRAVAEIFQPVVERSVMTACTTTRELIMKVCVAVSAA